MECSSKSYLYISGMRPSTEDELREVGAIQQEELIKAQLEKKAEISQAKEMLAKHGIHVPEADDQMWGDE